MISKLKGFIAAPYTPLKQNGDINPELIPSYLAYLQSSNMHVAFINGSTGDFTSLTTAERNTLVEAWCSAAGDDFTTMVHVGHTSLKECQIMAEHAGACGADYISALSPYYFKPASVELLVDFCAEVAAVNPSIPFYYYHIPVLSGFDVSMVDFIKIARGKIPNFVGIKFSKEDLGDYKLTNTFDKTLDILFGVDEIMLSSLAMGAEGWVGSTYNQAVSAYQAAVDFYKDGRTEEAKDIQYLLLQFVNITASYGWGGASKHVLKLVSGLDCGPVRAPHKNITSEEKIELKSKLTDLGFFDLIKKTSPSLIDQ